MRQTKRHSEFFRSLRHGMEQLEDRRLLADTPPTGDLTEGNASAWEAFADGSTASLSNNSTMVRQGSQSLRFVTQGGFDAGVRLRAPAANWNMSQIDVLAFWIYGENNNQFGWQGDQPVIKLLSAGGSITLTPSQQAMPNHAWAYLSIPLSGSSSWQRSEQGTFDIGNVTALEVHHDTWDFGFVNYYDGLQLARYQDLPGLNQPQGIAIDSQARTIVVETASNHLRVFNSAGDSIQTIGTAGSSNGQLQSPTDVAIGPSNRIYVSDSANNRIQIFASDGSFFSAFGSLGTGGGAFSNPTGVTYDSASGKLYVADSGNHRVQRFLSTGTLDSSWGVNGIVGTTAVLKRDHSGFDRPSDIAINPVTGQVYIADLGNQRIEVYSPTGQYVRTYLAIYQPRALAFDAVGNLYIAGDDPNDGYTAFDGRLRVLKAGEELVRQHFTGGADDIGRMLRGVALRADGRIVFSDTLNQRLVQIDSTLTPAVSNVAIKTRGSFITITWDSLLVEPSKVSFNGQIFTNSLKTRTHAVTINGLNPNTPGVYSIAFTDWFTGDERWTKEEAINSGASAGQTDFLRVKAMGLVYTDGDADAGYSRRAQAEIDAMRNRFQTIADFYWRNSRFKVWLDFTVREVDVDISSGVNLFERQQPDLVGLGFSAADEIDAVYSASPFAYGNFGGAGVVLGRLVASAIWTTQSDFVGIHEVNHSIDSLYNESGLKKYEFNHGIWAIPNSVGADYSVNAQILRNMLPANYTATKSPFLKRMSAADADFDGFPDSSPNGLLNPLSITEASFNSSSLTSDTDNDGLSDLAEAIALVGSSANPQSPDSDNDGVRDGSDLNPVYKMNNLVRRGTPAIDGTISASEGWTVVTNLWGYSNTKLVDDNNLYQSQITTYSAWDANYLYFALRGPAGNTRFQLDGDADNWFMGPSNYDFNIRNDFNALNVRVNAGVPDVFRQIDNDGQFSEFFDTDPKFTLPYNGRSVFDQPVEGLGFPGRLVSESDIGYQRAGTGNQRVWEIKIPWSSKTLLTPKNGKDIAVNFNFNGDALFESDHFARLRLVSSAIEAPLLNASGLVNYRENEPAVYLAPRGSVFDYDSFDLQQGKLTVSVVNAATTDRLQVFNAGLQPGQMGVSGSNLYFGGRLIGTFTGGVGSVPFVATLNLNATPMVAQALLRSITFHAIGDNPTPGNRTVQFQLTDGDGGSSAIKTVTVNVIAINDAPLINPASGGTLNYTQNTSAISLLSTATVTDADSVNFSGGVLTLNYTTGADSSNRLELSGSFSFSANNIMYGSVIIGTRNTNGGSGLADLLVTFNTNATASLIQLLIRSLRFRTVSGSSTIQRAIDVNLTDGDGGTSATVRTLINVNS